MISCSSCGKQNQDHYRFCLGCGAELPRPGTPSKRGHAPDPADEATTMGPAAAVRAAPRPISKPTPPPAAEPPPAPEPPPGTCSECQTVNPPTNRFCASCGNKIEAKKAPPQPKAKTVAPVETSGAVLVALDAEGNDIGRYELPRGETSVGRDLGGIFGNDAFLSPKHAVFVAKDGRLTVRDGGSLNGLFRKLLAEQRAPLKAGQLFRIGQELLVYEPVSSRQADEDGVVRQGASIDGLVGRVSLVVGRNTRSASIPLTTQGIHLGRERGDVTFVEDGYVSGLHCRVSFENGDVFVTDLGSSNGTFLQLLTDQELKNGDILLMGQQLFRVTL